MFSRFLCLLLLATAAPVFGASFAVADRPVPVFNTAAISAVFGGRDGASLATDRCGQLRSLEFVALPGTVFTIEGETVSQGETVYRVTTADYPYPTRSGYYVASQMVRTLASRPPERLPRLPGRAEILDRLRKTVGAPYVWGGNVPRGLAELLILYPPAAGLSSATRDLWQLRGVDCSGLLYQATDGATPRNTSALVSYGRGVPVAGQGAAAIAALLRPLDLLVWSGHVMIVLDRGEVIESRLDCARPEEGVIIRPLSQALKTLMERRRPADRLTGKGEKEFLVRRWFE